MGASGSATPPTANAVPPPRSGEGWRPRSAPRQRGELSDLAAVAGAAAFTAKWTQIEDAIPPRNGEGGPR